MAVGSDILRVLDESSALIDDRKLKIRERTDFPVSLNDVSDYTVDQLADAIAGLVVPERDDQPIRCLELYGDETHELCVLEIYDAERVEIYIGAQPAWPFDEDECRAMLDPLAELIGGELVSVHWVDELRPPAWDVVVRLNDLGMTLGQLSVFAREVRLMIELPRLKRHRDLGWLVNMLRSGHLNAIVGCAESNFLDFKMLTDLESNSGRIKIAREVAAFANGDCSAVLVIGYKTGKIDGVDTAVKLTPVASRGTSRTDTGRLSTTAWSLMFGD